MTTMLTRILVQDGMVIIRKWQKDKRPTLIDE